MLLKLCVLVLCGFCAGVGVSAGTFAFMLVIHVIPRMIQKAKMEKKVFFVENAIIIGTMTGCVFSVWDWQNPWPLEILGKPVLILFGLSAGIFVGCTAIALAEILDTFPIFFRRLNLKDRAAGKLLFCMAIGKSIGAFLYFYFGYGLP